MKIFAKEINGKVWGLFLNLETVKQKDVKGFEPNIHTYNAFNAPKGALIPEAGTVYFIPSHLDFKFSVNKSKKIHNHIMCSTMPVGVMGSDTSTLALNVNRDKDMYKQIIK